MSIECATERGRTKALASVVRALLLVAGDVERNPGPPKTAPRDEEVGAMRTHPGPRDSEGNTLTLESFAERVKRTTGAVIRTTHMTGICTDIANILGQACRLDTQAETWRLKVHVPLLL